MSVQSILTPNSRPRRGGLVVRPRDDIPSSPAGDSESLAPWLDNNPDTPSDYPSSLSSNLVRSNRAIILDPYQSQFASQGGDEADEIEATLKGAGYIVNKKVNTDVKIEDFKNLNQYGVIAIISHGARIDIPSKGEQVGIFTSVEANQTNKKPYQFDLKRNRLVEIDLDRKNYLAITPSFITQYTSTLPNSLVYLGTCDSTYNNTLAQAFLSKGAGAVVGYSNLVSSDFADRHGRAMFEAMVADRTTAEIPGIDVDRDPHNALFDLATGSDSDLTINIGLRNNHFEIGNLDGWEIQGDAEAIPELGPLLPTQGEKMAKIKTMGRSSFLSQDFFVPANARDLLLEYNLISEEPMEHIGLRYDDQFFVLLTPEATASNPSPERVTIANTSVNRATWHPISGLDLPGGDETTFHTGLQAVSFDLRPWQGQRVDLAFRVFNYGDLLGDLVALIDNIQITTV